jgi:hypothetical protein
MRTESPVVVRRQDTSPGWLVTRTDLLFELDPTARA